MPEKNKCKNCGYYNAFYTKSYDHFNKTKKGMCRKQRQMTEERQICEHWKDNSMRAEAAKRVSLDTLERAIRYIGEIAQIWGEEE